ncbi:MAG TPA: hypothetical protein VIJ38_12400 [Acidobacteriaceae bacterium]
MEDNSETENPKATAQEPHLNWWERFVNYVKSRSSERRTKRQQEGTAEWAARRTADATIWMAIFTVILAAVSIGTLLVLKKQLGEMQAGGVDTHSLANAAGNQATWTQRLANSADTQSGHMQELAARTKDVADQALVQAKEAKISADAARSAAETARDALIQVQRAFVFATHLDGVRIQDPKNPTQISSLDFSITWENSGTTPTRDMKSHLNWLIRNTPLPDDFTYPDFGDEQPSPIALGPKTVGHTTPISIPAADISKIMNHQELFYIWGWARYRDIFPKTKPHITRFCTEITGFQGNPLLSDPGSLSTPMTQNCANTCYDEECKTQ